MIIEENEFDKQIEDLLNKEKTARLANNLVETLKVTKQIAKLCFDTKQYSKFNELIVALSKKRGQPKKAQIELVQMAMIELKTLPINQKLEMIDAIMKVCEKKIYLEVEYARCVLMLTQYKEDDNQIADAAKILQEVQVETYGSMDKREKLEFILYQMKIMIKKLDYVRLFIISKKIEPKNIEDDNIADLKIIYYSFLVIYYRHENNYKETAHAYSKILESLHKNRQLEATKVDFNFRIDYNTILENYAMYTILSQYSEEKQKQLQSIVSTYKYALEALPNMNQLIQAFLGTELISTSPQSHNVQAVEIFDENIENNQQRFVDFRRQLIHHNLRIFQIYYDSIYLNRITELIEISTQELEEEICLMMDQKLLKCKIDRIQGIVDYQLKKNENDVLQEWGDNVNKVLNLIDLTSNLIKREEELFL
ncbi:unnamed protein product (macronuclear) [Paramecium tetraurelia]|uniref:PCI domain-containing protein n=1 Tax=Paramecium tetraurelia TaxID=5888 RepID=A0CRP8_PARTE|nr:uncharacterized protein GSPATT00009780001 [Paramecium tetraurelia]CAK73465.1 unnamed protein product [Paramecium tetraurelia]|eukprot:XP_001440862.1 hypothetical protein (macronuclear) [Paramecium tetraurelia strain d4-2]